MPRYWVIAPVESKPPELFDKVWQFDLANNLLSIGWDKVGDISRMSRDDLSGAVEAAYPDKPPATIGLIANMLWAFYHEISPGDLVIARRGRTVLAAAGKVLRPGFHAPGKNPLLAAPGSSHENFLEVEWLPQPRDRSFSRIDFPMFPMFALKEISDVEYRSRVAANTAPPAPETYDTAEETEDRGAFILEKYLEEFIVSNFDTIFKGSLHMYEDENGRQYNTDIGTIDILAVERKSNTFVVIELKKATISDQVVGQILRYMGWVKRNLCKEGQGVKGLVICSSSDDKLTYALEMTNNIDVRYYSVLFKLSEAP